MLRGLSQVEMQQQIDALTNDVRSLRGALEESNYKLQQATDRQNVVSGNLISFSSQRKLRLRRQLQVSNLFNSQQLRLL